MTYNSVYAPLSVPVIHCAALLFSISLCTLPCADASREEIAQLLGTPNEADLPHSGTAEQRQAEIDLGKRLFFDPILSTDRSLSCATCHNPHLGFGDGLTTGFGVTKISLPRNTPPLYNLAWNTSFFWDGRANSLEEQALGPIRAADEMGLKISALSLRLRADAYYAAAFKATYKDIHISKKNIARALAQYERTLISNKSAFDRFLQGDDHAMTPTEKNGMQLFVGKAKCIACHLGPNFTDQKFHNIGVQTDDLGRLEHDDTQGMKHAFKTPGLRNVILTAPYMHNGSVKDLQQVLELYRAGGNAATDDPDMGELDLTDSDIRALIAFLGALTDIPKE